MALGSPCWHGECEALVHPDDARAPQVLPGLVLVRSLPKALSRVPINVGGLDHEARARSGKSMEGWTARHVAAPCTG
eukprot:10414655-Alexandrium_andersonii.AAC.1